MNAGVWLVDGDLKFWFLEFFIKCFGVGFQLGVFSSVGEVWWKEFPMWTIVGDESGAKDVYDPWFISTSVDIRERRFCCQSSLLHIEEGV